MHSDEDIKPRHAPQAIAHRMGDFGVCSSLNLVIGCQTFTIVDLLLRDKNVLLAVNYALLFAFWHLLYSVVFWDLIGLKALYVPLEYYSATWMKSFFRPKKNLNRDSPILNQSVIGAESESKVDDKTFHVN